MTLVEEAFPNYDTAGKDGEKFRRFLTGIDKPLQIRIHEMGATSFNEALEIAVRVERANRLGQPSVATDFTVASTSPKRDATSATLEKVLKRLDELELKLERSHSTPGPQYSDRRLQPSRSPSPYDHPSRSSPRYSDDHWRQPSRSPSPYQPHQRRFRSPSPLRHHRTQSPTNHRTLCGSIPPRCNAYDDGRSASPQQSRYSNQANWQSSRSDNRHPPGARDTPYHQLDSEQHRKVRFDYQGNYW